MRTYIVITTLIFLMQAASAGAADIPVLDRLPAANGEFAAEVAEAIATLPVDVRRRFAEAGWQIELVEMVVDGAPELLRKRPSGWSKQSVWENADAVHLPSQKRILIATHRRDSSGRRVRTHRVAFVVRHEIGHAVDRIFGEAGKCYSESAAYRASHAADCESMKRSDRQSLDYYARRSSRAARRESFAELFAMQFGGGTEGGLADQLHRQFPRCLSHVKALIDPADY